MVTILVEIDSVGFHAEQLALGRCGQGFISGAMRGQSLKLAN